MVAVHDQFISIAPSSSYPTTNEPQPEMDPQMPSLRVVSATSEASEPPAPLGSREGSRGPSSVAGQPAAPATLTPASGARSLYVGKLHPAVNEAMLHSIFATLGTVEEVKVIRDKLSNVSAGYGFVTYQDHRCAELALHSFNGRMMYGQEVRVNWAAQREQKVDTTAHFHIFVGDLAAEVNDRMLQEAFSVLPGCSDARVVWDHTTGRSKGYGFVSYTTRESAERAIVEIGGTYIGSRVVRCGWAHHKRDTLQGADYFTVDQADPTNCNVYIGNISPEVEHEELRALVGSYGPMVSMRMYRKECYGFAEFESHDDAVRCILGLNGHLMGGKLLRMAWGRHQNRQAGQAGSSSGYRAAAAVPTAGMALGQMLDPATGGFMLAPGMMGSPGMSHLMGSPQGPPMQALYPGTSPLMMPHPPLQSRRGSGGPLGMRQVGAPLSLGQPAGMGMLDPTQSLPMMRELQHSMAGMSLMPQPGGLAQPPPPPMMMEGGGMVMPQGLQAPMLPPGAMPLTGEWPEGSLYYPVYDPRYYG